MQKITHLRNLLSGNNLINFILTLDDLYSKYCNIDTKNQLLIYIEDIKKYILAKENSLCHQEHEFYLSLCQIKLCQIERIILELYIALVA